MTAKTFYDIKALSPCESIKHRYLLELMSKRHCARSFYIMNDQQEVIYSHNASEYPNLGKGFIGRCIDLSARIEQKLISFLHRKVDDIAEIFYEGRKEEFGTIVESVKRFNQRKETSRLVTDNYLETNFESERLDAKFAHAQNALQELNELISSVELPDLPQIIPAAKKEPHQITPFERGFVA